MTSKSPKKKNVQRRCFVPGCKTGTAIRPRVKYSLFRAPSNEILRTKWITLIKRTDKHLNSSSSVCQLHFHPDCIEYSYFSHIYNCRLPRRRPRLKPDAIPTFFPKRRLPKKKPVVPKHNSKEKSQALIVHQYHTRKKKNLPHEALKIDLPKNPETSSHLEEVSGCAEACN